VDSPDFLGAEQGAPDLGRAPELPQPCPVTPLGKDGSKIYFLDSTNQLIETTANIQKGDLKLWFGNDWLETYFPQKDAKGNVTKFNQDTAQTALVDDCRRKGIFNPQGRVFGRGAHRARADDTQLILHMGRKIMMANARDSKGRALPSQMHLPGEIGGSFFPARPGLPAPANEASSRTEAEELRKFFRRWYWVDSDAASLLLLGFTAEMHLCGAMNWRSHVWLVGPTAAGKSELQKVIRAIHDEWCLHTEDASEAAIRQILGDDTLPVMIDEAEAHDRPERLAAILNLMKKSSSGAKLHRGGQDHKGIEFTAQSCFLLSSVLHANMRGEDRNRIAILEMRAVPLDAPELKVDRDHWRKVGRRMHRRMIEQWPRFDATVSLYKREIAVRGFEGRWRDTYGTLLACADLLLFDDVPGDNMLAEAGEGLDRVALAVTAIQSMMTRGRGEARTDIESVQLFLLSQMLPGGHGKPPESVATWLDRAMTLKYVPGEFITEEGSREIDHEARAKLSSYGLRVVSLTPKKGGGHAVADALAEQRAGQYLAVAYASNQPLRDLFKASDWAGGAWVQSLAKIEGAVKGLKIRFGRGGKPDNAVCVPLTAFDGEEG
jgi:hypothetical protein